MSAFATWVAKGALSGDAAATLRVWRAGAPEADAEPLARLLAPAVPAAPAAHV
jgi:hypothetical protein